MRHSKILIVLALAASPALAAAQDSVTKAPPPRPDSILAPGQKSTLSGVYTEQQANRGEGIYRTMCVACHDDSDHTGATFRQNWETRTAFDLFDTIRTTMPNDDPGKLPPDDYAGIVAYLFKMNRMPSGKQPLPTDDQGLKQIVIVLGDSTPQR